MIKMIMHGCNGKMGQVITGLVESEAELTIAAGIDLNDTVQNTYPVFKSLDECTEKADVIVDFANAKAVDALLDYCERTKTPVVLCTTGLSPEQLERVKRVSETVAVLRSANMSLGVNMLLKMVKEAARTLSTAGFDIEIVEKHHNQKVDAPSGTAIALADSINEEMDHVFTYKYDRSAERVKRDKKEIGITSVRGGSIVGEHDIIFAGQDEVVTFSHTAYSKAIFAKGAVEAAKYLAGKEPGLYDMADVIG